MERDEPEDVGITDAAEFNRRIYELVRTVPYGKVTSYGHIARLAHRPRNSRMVGQAMKLLPSDLSRPTVPPPPGSPNGTTPAANPEFVPWHRIVNSKGIISPRGSVRAVIRQADMLRMEGVEVRDGPREGDVDPHADAFGLEGVEGGRIPLRRFGWFPEPEPLTSPTRSDASLSSDPASTPSRAGPVRRVRKR